MAVLGQAVPVVGIDMPTAEDSIGDEVAGSEVAKLGTEAAEGSEVNDCMLGEGEGERIMDRKRLRQDGLGVPKPGLGLRDHRGILFFLGLDFKKEYSSGMRELGG